MQVCERGSANGLKRAQHLESAADLALKVITWHGALLLMHLLECIARSPVHSPELLLRLCPGMHRSRQRWQ